MVCTFFVSGVYLTLNRRGINRQECLSTDKNVCCTIGFCISNKDVVQTFLSVHTYSFELPAFAQDLQETRTEKFISLKKDSYWY